MGLFSRRSPAPKTPQAVVSPWGERDNLERITWTEQFGRPPGGPISRAEAMTVPSFARARNVLCATGGRLPIDVYANGVKSTGTWCVTQPERGRPRSITLAWTIDALICFGRAWWVVTERYDDEHARPVAFEWIPEWQATVVDGQLIGDAAGRTFKAEDVIRIDGPHEGVLSFAGDALREAISLRSAAGRAADNPVPAIELHQTTPDTLDEKERIGLRDAWAAARRGANGGVAYTPASLEVKEHGSSAEHLLVEGRRTADLEIVRAVGVPAWVVDLGIDGTSLTYQNVASRSRELVDYGLMTYLSPIEDRLSMPDILPPHTVAGFDLDNFLRADFSDRMNSLKVAIESGVYTLEEARALEHGAATTSKDNA